MTRLPSGWTDVSIGRSKCGRRFRHSSGWRIEHCGHPTALWPWAVYDPQGRIHTSGDACDFGHAFRLLDDAFAHVERHLSGDLRDVPFRWGVPA